MVTVLILAGAAAVYFFLAPDFIVYTADGPMLEAGWLASLFGDSPSPAPSAQTSGQPPVVIVSPVPASASPSAPAVSKQAPDVLRALYVPAEALADESLTDAYLALFNEDKINALVVDMKPESGVLSYKSSLDAAVRAGASSDSAQKLEQSVARLRDGGIYLVARMSCFKDNLLPRKQSDAAIKVESGVIWLDWYNHAWLNPFSKASTQYLTGVAAELDALGFDELMLDNLTFPVEGKLSYIRYGSPDTGANARTAALEGLIESVSAAVSDDTRLSACATPAALKNGVDTASGQTLSMYSSLDRVYALLPAENAQTAFAGAYTSMKQAQPENLLRRFVPVIQSPGSADAANAGVLLRSAITACGGADGLGFLVYSAAGKYPAAGF